MEAVSIIPWNIVTGCERLTPGCDNCPTYWEHKKKNLDYHPVFHKDLLHLPESWEGPTTCIVAPGSDLLHEAVRHEDILAAAAVMEINPSITFELGTKRVERLEAMPFKWPDNVVIMVAVEESRYKWRLDSLRNVRCKTKMVMFGPLSGRVGEIDMRGIDFAGIVAEHWGPNPRPVEQEWVDEIKEQCQSQGVVITENTWLCED